MKKHTTVTVDRKLLLALGACGSGIAEMSRFLPAKISTDPERNLPLALKLTKAHGDEDEHVDRAFWLVRRLIADRYDPLPDSNLLAGYTMCDTQYDAYIIAQWLAWSADAIATKAGR